MRAPHPMLYCDAEDGLCGSWELDYYAATVSAVNNVPVTSEERAPGWTSTRDGEDFCPEHKPTSLPGKRSSQDAP